MAKPLSPCDLIARYRAVKQVLAGLDSHGRKVRPGIGDPDVISLAQGNGVRRPHPSVIAAGVNALVDPEPASIETYASHARDSVFDAAIIDTFVRFGIDRETAGSICIDSGLTRLLAGFFFAARHAGDVFLVNRGFYHGFASLAEACRVRLVPLETAQERGFKIVADDVNAYMENAKARPGGLIIVQPGFTGELYDPEELAELARTIVAHDLLVFTDMTFACTEHDGGFFRPTLASQPEMARHVVSAMSGSKAFSLANIRIGWACGPKEIIAAMNFYATATGLSVPQVAKSMATAALRAPLAYLAENAREAKHRTRLVAGLIDEVNRHIAQHWADASEPPRIAMQRQPRSGHCVLASMEEFVGLTDNEGMAIATGLDMARYLLRTARVAVSPCYSGGIDRCLVRIAFGDVGAVGTYQQAHQDELTQAANRTKEARTTSPDFSLGRSMLRTALVDRMAPALAKLRCPGTGPRSMPLRQGGGTPAAELTRSLSNRSKAA